MEGPILVLNLPKDVLVYHIALNLDAVSALNLSCTCRFFRQLWESRWVSKLIFLRDYGTPRKRSGKGSQAYNRAAAAKEKQPIYWSVWLRGRARRGGNIAATSKPVEAPLSRRLFLFVGAGEKLLDELPKSFFHALFRRQISEEAHKVLTENRNHIEDKTYNVVTCSPDLGHKVAAIALHTVAKDALVDATHPYGDGQGRVIVGCCVCGVRVVLPIRCLIDAVQQAEISRSRGQNPDGTSIAKRMRVCGPCYVGNHDLLDLEFGPRISIKFGEKEKLLSVKQGSQWFKSKWGPDLEMLDFEDWGSEKIVPFVSRNRHVAEVAARKLEEEQRLMLMCVKCGQRKQPELFSQTQRHHEAPHCRDCMLNN